MLIQLPCVTTDGRENAGCPAVYNASLHASSCTSHPCSLSGLQDIAAKNAEAAAAAKTPEALQAIKDEEAAGENNAVLASAFITILLGGSTALSMAPVSENVKRVGEKVKTGKGRKY